VSDGVEKEQGPLTGVRFGGVGGQGIVLAGRLLGKAASLYDGKDAVCTQSYGPEARGGASRADVVISEDRVDYPFVLEADVLAVFFQEAYKMFRDHIKPHGLLLIDDLLVHPDREHTDLHPVPATRIAEDLGNKMAANVVMLGYLVGVTDIVSTDSVEQAVRSTLKPSILDMNLQALDAGLALARENEAA
jgi:2-oxoglutarate ferredoxin oxidoreductase subunit gamma